MKKLMGILAATSILSAASLGIAAEPIKSSNISANKTLELKLNESPKNNGDITNFYKKGNKNWEIGILAGKTIPVLGTEKRDADFILGGVSLHRGKMLCDLSESWMLPKGYVNNYEFSYGPNISLSKEGFFAGVEAMLTTHILPENKSVVISPLVGFGVQINDMYKKNVEQHAIGQQFIFDLTAGLKVKIPKWSNNISYGVSFNHKSYGSKVLSNWSDDAGAPNRNHGLNTIFATINYNF
jgi:hypothetical protein